MIFNSIDYLFFFPIVTTLYFLLPKNKTRIFLLWIASYFFYMCWNPVYISLILVSTVIDYTVGIQMEKTIDKGKRKLLLYVSLLANIGILFYFKYYNFLCENLQLVIDKFNPDWIIPEHHYLLPVGISFYTFQTLSYTIDIYQKKLQPESNFARFALYVSFFPQLVAGPIERAANLLPQLREKHFFEYNRVRSGLLLILWGMFKKVVVADRFALYVDTVYNSPTKFTGLATILASIFFSFQIYCDFSGYSDIAIGSARVLGYDLMENFKGPYFSKSIREFWQRWHISLSTWFRDYLYIPLGGNRGGKFSTYKNLLIVFLITGIWHGANWTFIAWGMFHGFFLIIERLGLKDILNKIPTIFQVAYVFIISTVGWVFFRADNIENALVILQQMTLFSADNFFNIYALSAAVQTFEFNLALFFLMIIWGVHYLENKYNICDFIISFPKLVRWMIYTLLTLTIFNFGSVADVPFVYFQF